MDCPTCHSETTKVIETHVCTNGTRRRRYRCLSCEHRWTAWDGERPVKGGSPGRRKSPGNRKSRLTPDQIRLALTRPDLNNKRAGELIGCSPECVRQIRNGQICASILPDLIRPNAVDQKPASAGPNCLDCKEWSDGRCSFGFPDPLIEGLTFAADCDLYAP
jgi:hypothetical protein